jgi:dihydrofolate reductase
VLIMGKVVYHITMSLDGFVAGRHDDMAWLFGGGFAPDAGFVRDFLGQVGAIMIGHRTYHGGDTGQGAATEKGRAYGGAWQGPQFVVTRDPADTAAPGFEFLGGNLMEATDTARRAAGDKYVAVLGPGLARQMLEAGLVDEILVHVVPVLLGDGVRLFDHPGGTPIRLDAVGSTPQVANLWLSVRR